MFQTKGLLEIFFSMCSCLEALQLAFIMFVACSVWLVYCRIIHFSLLVNLHFIFIYAIS